MKRLMSALITLSFIVSLPAMSLAQQPRPVPTKPSSKAERAAWANKIGVHDTRDIIGTRVKNAKGKDMGEVDALPSPDPVDGGGSGRITTSDPGAICSRTRRSAPRWI